METFTACFYTAGLTLVKSVWWKWMDNYVNCVLILTMVLSPHPYHQLKASSTEQKSWLTVTLADYEQFEPSKPNLLVYMTSKLMNAVTDDYMNMESTHQMSWVLLQKWWDVTSFNKLLFSVLRSFVYQIKLVLADHTGLQQAA